MRFPIRSGVLIASAATLVAVGASPVPADPGGKNSFPLTLVCDDGNTYSVVVSGNGEFTPAHDTASNRTFIPTSFGPFHGVVTDSSGTVIDEFTDPAVFKGKSNKPRRTSITCTFEVHEVFEDPELGELTFDGEGSVTGFRTPAR